MCYFYSGMINKRFWTVGWIITCLVGLFSCTTTKAPYNPARKIPADSLRSDFTLMRNILEAKHPGLYWYTPKDSLDRHFDSLYQRITDSMTEQQFGWQIIAPLTSRIRCGHTSFTLSSSWVKYLRGKAVPGFPFLVKVWGDTMIVTAALGKQQPTPIRPGTQITAIQGARIPELTQRIFQYLPTDGYANNVHYTRLSTNFPYYHLNIFGLYRQYTIRYLDTLGQERETTVPWFAPHLDTARAKADSIRRAKPPKPSIPRQERLRQMREKYFSLSIDSATRTATMELNTFSKGNGRQLRRFIRTSFERMAREDVQHLILDLRSNGGGDVSMYVLLTRYLRKTKFRVADTVIATSKTLKPYRKYFSSRLMYGLGLNFLTARKRDGQVHFGYWERHWYTPKRRHHFDGRVFVLTNGPTFSASTLFAHAVKGQENVWLVGEETGGGWHGNSGIMIPDITLPASGIRVRVPLFRIVQFQHVPFKGTGVWPDIYIGPTVDGVRQGRDRKLEIVRSWIRNQAFPPKPDPQQKPLNVVDIKQ